MTPERKSVLNKAYAVKNRDRLRDYQRDWVAKNHDKKLAYQKDFRERHKTEADRAAAREYARAYRARNREKVNAKERARKKRVPTTARRVYWALYRREHPLTPAQMERRRKSQQAWRDRNRVAFNAKRRAIYTRRVDETYIPRSTTRMEVEAEMWIAAAEGRDPETARREFFRREAGWAAKTVLLRSPHSDGPLYEERVA